MAEDDQPMEGFADFFEAAATVKASPAELYDMVTDSEALTQFFPWALRAQSADYKQFGPELFDLDAQGEATLRQRVGERSLQCDVRRR